MPGFFLGLGEVLPMAAIAQIERAEAAGEGEGFRILLVEIDLEQQFRRVIANRILGDLFQDLPGSGDITCRIQAVGAKLGGNGIVMQGHGFVE